MLHRILIADDHSMIRKGIKLLLQTHLGIKDIFEVSNGNGVMSELQKKDYTHLILDIILPDCTSLEIVPNIQRLYPDLKIMVFSMLNGSVYGEALKQYNIYYYLEKTTKEEDTIAFLDNFINHYNPADVSTVKGVSINPFIQLSARELEVLHYMLGGHGTKDISTVLNLRMNTVSTLKNRIFEKTDTKNLKELMQLASLYNVN
ncbi:MAG: response regulator transcription factor [Flavipsychrobacter sp.]|nr:response regulator transcription factor [Flavipsychrobacter sp.]